MVVGVQRVLVFAQESAARSVARELAGAGCRSVTVRQPGGGRMWDVVSPAVYPVPGDDPELLSPLLRQERRRLAALARSRGGALLTYVSYVRDSGGDRAASNVGGPVHEDAMAHMALPVPLPVGLPQPGRAPAWTGLHFCDPEAEIAEAAAVAHRMYGTSAAAPPPLAFLMDDDPDEEFAEPDGTRLFLADLVSTAHHLPVPDGGMVAIVPFITELARSRPLSPGARVSLLLLLLGLASEPDTTAVRHADLAAMSGRQVALDSLVRVREAVIARIPALLPQWETESGAVRFVLASLAAFCPAQTAAFVRPLLPDIPAPPRTGRADILALADALLAEDAGALHAALHRMAAWDDDLAEMLDSPYACPSRAARAALAAAVARDLPAALHLT
ncbi:hypothetical protein ACFV9D_32445 [Streptomyces sp. NPDC059875]|uniref:hypothetical protein n=1 Tax=unclassified Streptomyces TaxID=2593676 RepID=UPI0036490F8F